MRNITDPGGADLVIGDARVEVTFAQRKSLYDQRLLANDVCSCSYHTDSLQMMFALVVIIQTPCK
jgi:hypothetical protein